MTKSLHYRACHLCEAICGLAIETEAQADGSTQIRSIKGDVQDSFSRGHICPKAVALQDIQNDPDRIRQPMRRVGEQWQAIGWDEAFDLVAERLSTIQAAHGQNAVAVYHGNPSVHNYGLMTHSNYFLGQLKTRNRFSATSVDQLPHHLTSLLMYGHGLLIPIPDIDHTDFMLILGGNPLASNGSIMTVPDVEKRLKAIQARGGKLVVVDPRRSETAAIADQHLFVRPGSDAALLLALLNTLFEEGLTRDSHLPVEGLQQVREAIGGFHAEAMSARCGVPAETIRQLARDFAAADKAVCYGRMGVSTQAFGTLCQWLVQVINLVTGNLDRSGGVLCTTPAVDLVASTSGGHFNRWQSRVSGLPEYGGELPVSALAEEMLTPGEGQIRALVTVAGNPVLSTPNGRQLEQALDGLEGDDLVAPAGLLSQLVLRSSSYARQFLEAGGLDEPLVRRLLRPGNPPSVLVDALLAVSQLARLSQRHYPAIARAAVCDSTTRLLSHEDPGVRARSCNLLGNMCRHSGYFYEHIARHGILDALIARCEDSDKTVRSFF